MDTSAFDQIADDDMTIKDLYELLPDDVKTLISSLLAFLHACAKPGMRILELTSSALTFASFLSMLFFSSLRTHLRSAGFTFFGLCYEKSQDPAPEGANGGISSTKDAATMTEGEYLGSEESTIQITQSNGHDISHHHLENHGGEETLLLGEPAGTSPEQPPTSTASQSNVIPSHLETELGTAVKDMQIPSHISMSDELAEALCWPSEPDSTQPETENAQREDAASFQARLLDSARQHLAEKRKWNTTAPYSTAVLSKTLPLRQSQYEYVFNEAANAPFKPYEQILEEEEAGFQRDSTQQTSTAQPPNSTIVDPASATKAARKKQRQQTRAALREAWKTREDIRKRVVASWTLEDARGLENATIIYNNARNDLINLSADHQLVEEDAKAFPYLSELNLTAPKVWPQGVDGAPKIPPSRTALPCASDVPQSNRLALMTASALTDLIEAAVGAGENYTEALEEFNRPPPQVRSNVKDLETKAKKRAELAAKRFLQKVEVLEELFPMGLPGWLEKVLF